MLADEPVVFRGASRRRAVRSLGALALTYASGYAALWAMGLVIRGWRGWVLLLGPLVIFAGSRLISWRRVSVSVDAGRLRYEGSAPARDFELPVDEIAELYWDATLPGRPLVLTGADRDERVCEELDRRPAERLRAWLLARGVSAVDEA